MAKQKREEIIETVKPQIPESTPVDQNRKKALLASKWYEIKYAKLRNNLLEACLDLGSHVDQNGNWLFSVEEIDEYKKTTKNPNHLELGEINEMRIAVEEIITTVSTDVKSER